MSFVNARRTAVILAAVLTGACSDVTGPTIDHVDAAAATTAAAPVIAVMDQPALASFTSLGAVSGLPASASAASINAVSLLTRAAARGQWDRRAPLMARSAAKSADVLPIDVRGNMYVYNTTTLRYEVSGSPDATTPASGIRVVLYAWDVLNGRPSSPLTRIGHVDLVDESNASQNRLNVVLVRANGNTTLMDYDITHSVSTSSESFSIAGSATNGITPVVFNLSGNASETAANITFDLEAETVGFEVHVGMNANEATQQASVETSLGYNGHTLWFGLWTTDEGIDGEIKFDNMKYAELSIVVVETPGSVTTTVSFQKANGSQMTVEEIEEIQAVFERALNFAGFWEALLWPVGSLAESPI
jgi:hypothetical protein